MALTPVLAETQSTKAFTIISKSAGHLDIRFDLPAYELQRRSQAGTEYQKIIMPDAAYPSDPGMPELPVLSTLIAIPDHGSARVELISSRTRVSPGFIPYPGQEESSGQEVFALNRDYYDGSLSLPLEPLFCSQPQIMRDLRVVQLEARPFVWNAKSRELKVHEQLTLRISFDQEPGINEFNGTRSISAAFDRIYASQVLNYQDYRVGQIANTPPKIVLLHGSYADPVFQNIIKEYALWKRQKGADVLLLSTAETGTTNTAIKAYLQGLYDDPQTRFDYLTIIGDVTGSFAVPAWNAGGIGDYPYQMLAGNDLLGEVFLGRISAENTSQLLVIMAKIYAYEKNINVNAATYLNRMLLVSDTLYSGLSVANISYYIKEISQRVNPNYSYTILNQNAPSPSAVNTAINQGVGIHNYRGYAGMSGWSVNESNLFNTNRLNHAVILTCNTGNYDATGTTEQYIRVGSAAAPIGAVTAIGMWGAGTATMPNNALCGGIFDGIYVYGMRTMGEALLHSKLNFSRLYGISNPTMSSTFNQWCNLMGDPSMEVYVTIPRTFSSNAPAVLVAGSNSIDLTVLDQDGFPVADAMVTVSTMQDGTGVIISRACSDADGMVYLPFSAQLTEGTAVLTVSKHDFKPLQLSIPVGAGSLLAGIPLIDDNQQGASNGNGNGVANSGESLEVLFALRNTSSSLISGISGQIGCNDPLVSLTNTILSFGDIQPGTSGFCASPVVVQISPATANHSLLRFNLQLTDAAGNTYQVADYLSVTGAELRLESFQISGGGDAVLDPGETAALYLSLKNLGTVAVNSLMAELFSGNDLVAIPDSLGFLGNVEAGATVNMGSDTFTLMGRADLVPGMIIPLRLRLSNPEGFLQWLQFSITVGTVTVNDPLGPDSYGYLIYDDTDTSYDDCPVYNWIGIAPPEGGSGTALNISDPDGPSEGDDLSTVSLATVSLPFNFRFYGQDYQQITVCSNGFIVFGVTDNTEFRNYRMPGPMGPSPMVAAFWDDLATGPGSGIYTWHDESSHSFVIEWYQMLNGYDNDYPETFQVILYDPAYHSTSYGDGPIKIQYHTFNNVDSGVGNQNHGNFCTIGIESADQLDGLEYTFNNTYPVAASPLGNGRALYITNAPVYYNNAHLVPETTVINDQNNSIAEPGETIEMGVVIQNLGNLPATDVSAVISCYDPYVTLINADSDYHPIPGHSSGINREAFVFSISQDCPDFRSISFTISISSSSNSWNHSFSIRVQKAGVVYESFFLNDIMGNNNGYADSGESFLLVVNVHNPSQVAVQDLIGQLSSANANITISNPVLQHPILEGSAISQFVYEVSLSASTPLNSTVPLTFSLSSANSPNLTATIGLGCGQMGMNSSFEDDNGGFSAQNGWSWGTPDQVLPHSGSKLWGTTLSGQYGNGANYKLTSPPVAIGTGAELSFWHQLFCQSNFDGGNVSVSVNGGASWIVISPSSGGTYVSNVYSMNEPGFSGTIGVWTRVSFDLSQFANSQVLFRWHFTSDGNTTGFGWFIDDVMVSGYAIRSGVISGTVTLSEAADPSSARVSTSLRDTQILASPNSMGSYALYLPAGSYSLTAGMPYHVSASSPTFIITDSSLDYVHDFSLTYLPPVTGFSLFHDSDEGLLTLNWEAPEEPAYPVLEYKVYRKTGPGLSEVIATVTDPGFSESLSLDGHYYYLVRPRYAPGEGAPSDTLELVISTTVANDLPPLPGVNALHPNYPNPFNPSTTISLQIAQAGTVRLGIYNLRGQLVKTLANGSMEAGQHRLVWNGLDEAGRPVASGVYLYRLEGKGFSQSRKMLLLK